MIAALRSTPEEEATAAVKPWYLRTHTDLVDAEAEEEEEGVTKVTFGFEAALLMSKIVIEDNCESDVFEELVSHHLDLLLPLVTGGDEEDLAEMCRSLRHLVESDNPSYYHIWTYNPRFYSLKASGGVG